MFYSKLILFAVLAASAVPATQAGRRRKKRCTAKNPRNQGVKGSRCADGLTVPKLLECSSGSGYDGVRFDFDILSAIVNKLDAGQTLEDLEDCTIFMPTDLGFCVLAEEAGVHSSGCNKNGFDEEGVFESLAGDGGLLNVAQLSDVLNYHLVTDGAMDIKDLYERVVTTSLGEDLTLEGAKPQNCPDRVKLIDEGRKENISQNRNNLGGYPKVHNSFYNMKLSKNCKAHAIKNVLLSKKTLKELGIIQ